MKILHLIFSLNIGGAETMLVDILDQQVKSGRELFLIVVNKSVSYKLLYRINKKIKIILLNRPESSRNPYWYVLLNYWLVSLKPDIIHCHNETLIKFILPIFHKKSVLTIHDIGIEFKNYGYYKKLFSISHTVKNDILERYNIDSNVIYNGIETKKIETKKRYNANLLFRIIIVSRLQHEKKGQHIVLEALSILKKKGINKIHLDFIGSGKSESYLKSMTERLGLEQQVSFLGLQDREYIYSHLKDYELLIQPSIYEGFGLTIIEAVAAGLPVLVSACDGPLELMKELNTGYMFNKGDAKDCAEKIGKIMLEYGTYKMLQNIEQNKNKVKENFDISFTANEYLQNYIKLI